MADQSFPKLVRLKTPRQFSRVIHDGRHAADKTLVVNALPNGLEFNRIGITIPKKTGNAVVRNCWKRLIREAFRTQQDAIPGGQDLVVRPRRGAKLDGKEIRRSLVSLGNRFG